MASWSKWHEHGWPAAGPALSGHSGLTRTKQNEHMTIEQLAEQIEAMKAANAFRFSEVDKSLARLKDLLEVAADRAAEAKENVDQLREDIESAEVEISDVTATIKLD